VSDGGRGLARCDDGEVGRGGCVSGGGRGLAIRTTTSETVRWGRGAGLRVA
jgi:hypothetical protein